MSPLLLSLSCVYSFTRNRDLGVDDHSSTINLCLVGFLHFSTKFSTINFCPKCSTINLCTKCSAFNSCTKCSTQCSVHPQQFVLLPLIFSASLLLPHIKAEKQRRTEEGVGRLQVEEPYFVFKFLLNSSFFFLVSSSFFCYKWGMRRRRERRGSKIYSRSCSIKSLSFNEFLHQHHHHLFSCIVKPTVHFCCLLLCFSSQSFFFSSYKEGWEDGRGVGAIHLPGPSQL